MTAEQLDEIQKSLDAATPGPWEAKEKEVHTAKEDMEGYKTQVCKFTPSRIAASNIHLIANAPTWLRSLLAEVQRQQGEIERLVKKQTERAYAYDALSKDFISVQGENVRLQAENDQLRQQLGEAVEVLEWYGDEGNYDPAQLDVTGMIQIDEDGGKFARAAIAKLKGDRTDG